MPDTDLLTAFNFHVVLSGADGAPPLGDGGFQEVTGLEVEMDVTEYLEGGRNDGVVQRVGRAKYGQRIVLKRGMFMADDTALPDVWQWFQDIVVGVRPVRRYDGAIEVLTPAGDVGATWRFRRGLPARLVGPSLNARSGEIAIEELHIAHEGLFLEGTT